MDKLRFKIKKCTLGIFAATKFPKLFLKSIYDDAIEEYVFRPRGKPAEFNDSEVEDILNNHTKFIDLSINQCFGFAKGLSHKICNELGIPKPKLCLKKFPFDNYGSCEKILLKFVDADTKEINRQEIVSLVSLSPFSFISLGDLVCGTAHEHQHHYQLFDNKYIFLNGSMESFQQISLDNSETCIMIKNGNDTSSWNIGYACSPTEFEARKYARNFGLRYNLIETVGKGNSYLNEIETINAVMGCLDAMVNNEESVTLFHENQSNVYPKNHPIYKKLAKNAIEYVQRNKVLSTLEDIKQETTHKARLAQEKAIHEAMPKWQRNRKFERISRNKTFMK